MKTSFSSKFETFVPIKNKKIALSNEYEKNNAVDNHEDDDKNNKISAIDILDSIANFTVTKVINHEIKIEKKTIERPTLSTYTSSNIDNDMIFKKAITIESNYDISILLRNTPPILINKLEYANEFDKLYNDFQQKRYMWVSKSSPLFISYDAFQQFKKQKAIQSLWKYTRRNNNHISIYDTILNYKLLWQESILSCLDNFLYNNTSSHFTHFYIDGTENKSSNIMFYINSNNNSNNNDKYECIISDCTKYFYQLLLLYGVTTIYVYRENEWYKQNKYRINSSSSSSSNNNIKFVDGDTIIIQGKRFMHVIVDCLIHTILAFNGTSVVPHSSICTSKNKDISWTLPQIIAPYPFVHSEPTTYQITSCKITSPNTTTSKTPSTTHGTNTSSSISSSSYINDRKIYSIQLTGILSSYFINSLTKLLYYIANNNNNSINNLFEKSNTTIEGIQHSYIIINDDDIDNIIINKEYSSTINSMNTDMKDDIDTNNLKNPFRLTLTLPQNNYSSYINVNKLETISSLPMVNNDSNHIDFNNISTQLYFKIICATSPNLFHFLSYQSSNNNDTSSINLEYIISEINWNQNMNYDSSNNRNTSSNHKENDGLFEITKIHPPPRLRYLCKYHEEDINQNVLIDDGHSSMNSY